MAGAKKKKKPASNPARGFATTSIASKPRAETTDTAPNGELLGEASENNPEDTKNNSTVPKGANEANPKQELSPEEFEKQLEESELQILVDKHSQRAKREASRQVTKLQTDRRLLRSQAEFLNTRKWLPPELMDEILDAIMAESRSAGQVVNYDASVTLKVSSEEDLTIRLWTLQQTLEGAGFHTDKISQVISYVLGVSDRINSGAKDTIWGLEESLDWLARECARDELPDYDNWQRKANPRLKPGTYSRYFFFVVLTWLLNNSRHNELLSL